jgi:hypothetical protein
MRLDRNSRAKVAGQFRDGHKGNKKQTAAPFFDHCVLWRLPLIQFYFARSPATPFSFVEMFGLPSLPVSQGALQMTQTSIPCLGFRDDAVKGKPAQL